MGTKIGLYILLFFLFLSVGCTAQSKSVTEARSKLKKWGIAYSITQIRKGSYLDTLAGNSEAAYFELGSHNQNAYEEIRKFIQNYLKVNYNSKDNKDLSLMKCIDLTTNPDYEKKIIYCDKWISKD